jgi:hypothetical protein
VKSPTIRRIPAALPSRIFRLSASLAVTLAITVVNLTAASAAPTISVTAPTNNAVLQGTVTLQATAGLGTLGVRFKLNGGNLGSEDKVPPYAYSWNTTTANYLNNTNYTITATARDATGSTTSVPITVKLNNPPVPGTVIVVGDSVSQQAFDPNADGSFTYTTSAPPSAKRKVLAHMGWDATDVEGAVSNNATLRWPEKLVVGVGLVDAATLFGDGWTPTDLDHFRTLINTPHTSTCVAIVLPGHGATGDTPWFAAWATEIDEARVDLAQLATERPHTMTIDWQTVLDQHPEYVDNDGIHLLTPSTWEEDIEAASQDQMLPVDQGAADARQEFSWAGAAQCTI